MCTLRGISNWSLYKIWYYATYLINKSKVGLFLYCTHQSIDFQKENAHSCTKSSMRNGRCESSQWARVSRVWHDSCRIWLECILCGLAFIKNNKYGENEYWRTRSSRRNDKCRHAHQTGMLRVVIKVAIRVIICTKSKLLTLTCFFSVNR